MAITKVRRARPWLRGALHLGLPLLAAAGVGFAMGSAEPALPTLVVAGLASLSVALTRKAGPASRVTTPIPLAHQMPASNTESSGEGGGHGGAEDGGNPP